MNWLNRHYLKASSLSRLAELSVPFLAKAGYVTEPASPPVLVWLERVVDAVLKNLDFLEQLPEAARLIFEYDLAHAREDEAVRQVMEEDGARAVLRSFIPRILATREVTYEIFRAAAAEVQKETGKKGRELFHPVRVALTARASGPELEKLVPIFEEGARLALPRPVKSTVQRLQEFAAVAKIL